MSIKEIAKQYIDIKPIIASIVTIVVMSTSVGFFGRDYIDNFKNNLKSEIVDEIENFILDLESEQKKAVYVIVQYDLLKQLEKLISDPTDIKTTDIDKFLYFCEKDSYFSSVFIPGSNNPRGLQIACLKVQEEYDKRYNQIF